MHMKNFIFLMAIALILAPGANAQDDSNALDYLPPAQFLPGWEKSGNEFVSRANGAGFMVGDILPLLLEYNLQWYATDTYYKGPDEMRIEIFEFPSASDAFGFYSVSYITEPDPDEIYVEKPYAIPPLSTMDSIRRISGPERDILEGYQDRFYFRIDISEELLDVNGVRAGMYLMGELPGIANPADLVGVLPGDNRVHGTERYIRGPLGLNRLIDANGLDLLGFDTCDYKAVGAMYRLGAGEYFFLLITEYDDQDVSEAIVSELTGYFQDDEDWQTVMLPPLSSGIHPRGFTDEISSVFWSDGSNVWLLWDLTDMEAVQDAMELF